MFLSLTLAYSAGNPGGDQIPRKEYQVKAIFLFNFSQFIEWPPNAFSKVNEPLIIGILGRDPFGTYLEETIHNEKIGEHPLVVKRFKSISEIDKCHILFVDPASEEQLASKAAKTRLSHTLIVGEASRNFMMKGGMIGFFVDSGKIRMKINLEEIKKSGLKISSKLLSVAEVMTVQK